MPGTMAAQPNATAVARLLYFVSGVAAVGWALWGSAHSWIQWLWLALGGVAVVLGLIGFSPLHALFGSGREITREKTP